MDFDQKYPDAAVDFQPPLESIFKAATEHICLHCGKSTNWIDYCFEAALCSEECYEFEWQEYQKAVANED